MKIFIFKRYAKKLHNLVSLIFALNRGKKIGDGQYHAKGFFFNRMTLHNKHEVWLDDAYSAALNSKEGAFIDVGANTGQTLVKILSIDTKREYVGFEPQIECSFFINQFIKENNMHTHRILPLGLSNKSGVLQLLKRSGGSDTSASTTEGFRPADFYTAKQPVFVAKGDDVISELNLKQISAIKIDVEGGELEVVEGMRQVLRDNIPFVFFEVLNHFMVVTGQKLDEQTISFREARNEKLEEILRDLGYTIFNILPDKTIIEISKIQPKVSSDLKITDYVAVHHEYINAFLEHFNGKYISE